MYTCSKCQEEFLLNVSYVRHTMDCRNSKNPYRSPIKCMDLATHKKGFIVKKRVRPRLKVRTKSKTIPLEEGKAKDPPKSTDSDGTIVELVVDNNSKNQVSTSRFIKNCKLEITEILVKVLSYYKQIQYNISLHITFWGNQKHTFASNYIVLDNPNEINETIDVLIELLAHETRKFAKEHIGLISNIFKADNLKLHVKKLIYRKGGHLPIPDDVNEESELINIKNNDNFCFKWAIITGIGQCKTFLHPDERGEISSYQIENIVKDHIHYAELDLDFSGLRFPLEVRDCRIFEEKNPHISVNVFGLEKSETETSRLIGPLYRTRREQELHLNLLFLENQLMSQSHYVCIVHLARFLAFYHPDYGNFVCNTCIRPFDTEGSLSLHKEDKGNCDSPIALT